MLPCTHYCRARHLTATLNLADAPLTFCVEPAHVARLGASMSVVFDLPLFWLYLGQRHYWRDISYTAAWKRWVGLRVGRLFIGFVWVSRESVPVCLPALPRGQAGGRER